MGREREKSSTRKEEEKKIDALNVGAGEIPPSARFLILGLFFLSSFGPPWR
jgi:hypothetical protein